MKNKFLRPRTAWFRSIAFVVAVGLASMPAVSFGAPRTLEPTVGELSIDFDVAKLFAVDQRGAAMEINIAADRVLTLSHERVLSGSDGARTWVGQARELSGKFSDGTAYITELQGNVYGTISTGATTYELIGRPGEAVVVRDLAAKGFQRKISLRNDAVIPPILGPRVEVPPLGSDRQKVVPTPQVTIDVMIVYTAAMTTRYGAGAGIATRLNNQIAQANDSYLRSEVAITLRLVRSEQTSYTNAGDNSVALDDLGNARNVFSTIPATRNTFGADLVTLMRVYEDLTHNGCGVAYVGGGGGTTLLSQFGYSVVSDGVDLGGSGFVCVDTTFQHELGHNMGLLHDRANVPAGETGATAYAFGYIIPGTFPSVGDIMSYADRYVPCFSSPAVFRQGPGSGLSGGNCNVTPASGDVLGVPASNPISSADAAAALNFTRVSVSNFRAAVGNTISGTITNGAGISGVTFCARPAAGVTCSASNGSGVYSCTVPNGWTGTLHSPSVAGNRIPAQSFTAVSGNITRNITALSGIPGCNLDVDNNGLFEPATDGVAILRRLLGFDSAAFAGLAGTCAANISASAIFAATASNYNVTGGALTLPTTDGLVILRAMLGLTGTAVTNSLGLTRESSATNTAWTSIQPWLNSNCGSSFSP